jgi:UPF0042 nucleotide-binding protein
MSGSTVGLTGIERDVMLRLQDGVAAALKDADRRGIAYILVHVGPDQGEPGGSHERAHHRVEAAQLPELAHRLRSRETMLVTCLAFAFRNGIPPESAWVIDARFLDNPYWVEELRPLDGRDHRVQEYVLGQPEAVELLDGLEGTLRSILPAYRRRGRMELTVAFGCTGGRHRSVVLAGEMAKRLSGFEGIEVEVRLRDL